MSQDLNPAAVEEYLVNLSAVELEQLMDRVAGSRVVSEPEPVEREEWEVISENIERKQEELRNWAAMFTEDVSDRELSLANAEYDRLSLEIVELEERLRRLNDN